MYTRQDNTTADDIFTATQEYYYRKMYDLESHPLRRTRVTGRAVQAIVYIIQEYERIHCTEVCIDLLFVADYFIQVNLNDPTLCPSVEKDYINNYCVAGTFMRTERPHLLIKKDSPMLYLFTAECTPVTIPFSPYSDVPAAYDKDLL